MQIMAHKVLSNKRCENMVCGLRVLAAGEAGEMVLAGPVNSHRKVSPASFVDSLTRGESETCTTHISVTL